MLKEECQKVVIRFYISSFVRKINLIYLMSETGFASLESAVEQSTTQVGK